MLAALAALFIGLQDNVPPSEADIERAIKAGTKALILQCQKDLPGDVAPHYGGGQNSNALILYTLVHSGIGLHDETVQQLLEKVLGARLTRTYMVALTAAALSAIDPVKHQGKLAQCAQFLVDWQCENGQWGYGDAYEPPAYGGPPPDRGAKGTVAKIRVSKIKRLGPLVGDNSNSQYAALGLKACSSGCEIDSGTLTKAMEWWEKSQQKNGGWSYHENGVYQEKFGTYGSMTAGAVSSLIMIKQLKNSDPKVHTPVIRGVAWLAENFTVEENACTPPGGEDWHHYYLYALERVGDLYPTEKFGRRAWYAAGAAVLLKTQRPDGTWQGTNPTLSIADTCFALLFLERVARRPPVMTGGKSPPPPPK